MVYKGSASKVAGGSGETNSHTRERNKTLKQKGKRSHDKIAYRRNEKARSELMKDFSSGEFFSF